MNRNGRILLCRIGRSGTRRREVSGFNEILAPFRVIRIYACKISVRKSTVSFIRTSTIGQPEEVLAHKHLPCRSIVRHAVQGNHKSLHVRTLIMISIVATAS